MKKFTHLHIPETWKHYWTKYPEGYTILESLLSWVSQVDSMVTNINDWNEYLYEFVEKYDKRLQTVVVELLNEMRENGDLADVINNEVFNMKANQEDLEELDSRLTSQLTQSMEDIKERAINISQPPFNAVPNTDVTDIVNQAIIHVSNMGGGKVFIPSNHYLVDATRSIILKSNITLEIADGGVLEAIPTADTNYAVIKASDIENISVIGGSIKGEKDNHLGTTGEWGFGLDIRGCKNVLIKGVAITDCWGDGVYVGRGQFVNVCENVIITESTISNHRRQGISVVACVNCVIDKNTIQNIKGTAPMAGIDVEPNVGDYCEDIRITNNYFKYNFYGVLIYGVNGGVKNIVVNGNTMRNSERDALNLNTVEEVQVKDNIIKNIDYSGVRLIEANKCELCNNLVNNTNISGVRHSVLLGSSSHNVISGNRIFGNKNNGISLGEGCKHNTIENNTIYENGGYGVQLYSIEEPLQFNIIKGNTISENSSHGVSLTNTNDSMVVQNMFISNTTRNISLYGADNNLVSENIARSIGESKPSFSISIDGNSNDNMVTNNDLLNSASSGPMQNQGISTVLEPGNRS